MLLPYVVGGNVGSVTVLALVNKHFKFRIITDFLRSSESHIVRSNADSPCRWGCLLDRFWYWRWLGNGSSSDDYEFPTFIGVNVGSVSQLALVRNQESHIVRSNADSPCRWGCLLDRFRYWRWLGNGSSSDDYEFPTFIGVNVGSVSQLALVKNQVGSEKYRLSSVIGGNIHDLFLY
ncbi:hypothetical protein J6590_073468 [Homalodisca vitripennis]|nr:hypothetical protein J6590_073468 [Homalodisca vitripennis]